MSFLSIEVSLWEYLLIWGTLLLGVEYIFYKIKKNKENERGDEE